NVDASLLEHFLLLWAEVIADDGNDAYLREVTCGERKVGGSAGQNVLHAARGRCDVVECDGTDYEYAHEFPLLGTKVVRSRISAQWPVISTNSTARSNESPAFSSPSLSIFR